MPFVVRVLGQQSNDGHGTQNSKPLILKDTFSILRKQGAEAPFKWALHSKDKSSATGAKALKIIHWKAEPVGGRQGRGWREQRFKWCQEKIKKTLMDEKGNDTHRERDVPHGDRLRDGQEGGCGYCSASWWWILTRSSQLVMGACELLEHDSVLKGHTEAPEPKGRLRLERYSSLQWYMTYILLLFYT